MHVLLLCVLLVIKNNFESFSINIAFLEISGYKNVN